MFSKLILYLFIFFFIFILFSEISSSSMIIEGLTTDSGADSGADSGNLGITVGRYTAKIDQLGKTVDSMQATILGLLPTVAKNAQDNAKNQQALQAIIANKDKT